MNVSATFQKTLGNITLLESQLSFSNGKDVKNLLVLPFELIQAQFVNVLKPNGKIILKLQLKDSTVSFTFSKPEDRESVKNWIAQRLVQDKQDSLDKDSIDLQTRQQLLSKDLKLCQNHQNWVNKGFIKENEFWETLKEKLKEQEWLNSQNKGPSSLLLSELKPSGSGESSNDLKYTLNPEIIHSIFTTYPAVLKAYQENVPLKMTEKEFWIKYFSSQYYYRKKMGSTSNTKISGDIFDMYAEIDDEDLLISPKNLIYTPSNNLLDLASTNQDHEETGNRLDFTMRHGKIKESLGLIRRFNRHSDMVLKAIQEKVDVSVTSLKMDEIYENETEITDLKIQNETDVSRLSIKDPSNYYPGDKRPHSAIDQQSLVSLENLKQDLAKWNPASLESIQLSSFLDSETPKKLCNLITNHNRTSTSFELDSLVPFVSGVNELLRHSWALFHLKLDDSGKLAGIHKALDQHCRDHSHYASRYPIVWKSIQDRIYKSQNRVMI